MELSPFEKIGIQVSYNIDSFRKIHGEKFSTKEACETFVLSGDSSAYERLIGYIINDSFYRTNLFENQRVSELLKIDLEK